MEQHIREQRRVEEWVETYFSKGEVTPFSFVYGGRSSSQLCREWMRSETVLKEGGAAAVRSFTWTDPGTGLEVECTCECFSEFPAVEWVVSFRCHTWGLNLYLPCSGTGSNWPDPYAFRSSMGSSLILGWKPVPARLSRGRPRS